MRAVPVGGQLTAHPPKQRTRTAGSVPLLKAKRDVDTFLIFLMFLIVIVGVRCSDAFGAGPRLVSYRKYLTESILAPFVPVSFPQGTPRALSWPRS